MMVLYCTNCKYVVGEDVFGFYNVQISKFIKIIIIIINDLIKWTTRIIFGELSSIYKILLIEHFVLHREMVCKQW